MQKLVYKLLYYSISVFSLLPMWVWYRFSYVIYVVLFHVLKYRKDIAFRNLSNAFPLKSKNEINLILKKSYKHLADVIVESFTINSQHPNRQKKRIIITNVEELSNCYEKGKDVMVLLAHYGNWESQTSIVDYLKHHCMAVYQPLNNPYADDFVKKFRMHKNLQLITKKNFLREVLRHKQQEKLIASYLIYDQRPHPSTKSYKTTFLNQETYFQTGAEGLAKKFKQSVFFIFLDKIKRGFYKVRFEPIPYDTDPEKPFEITEKFARLLEKEIIETPELWLWTHNRWRK